jgi:hypothetical protein
MKRKINKENNLPHYAEPEKKKKKTFKIPRIKKMKEYSNTFSTTG